MQVSSLIFLWAMAVSMVSGLRWHHLFTGMILEKEKQTELLLFPFCYMEANSFYEQKFSAKQALEEMRYYYDVTKSVNGTFIMIWHNHFFGTDKLFEGWKEAV